MTTGPRKGRVACDAGQQNDKGTDFHNRNGVLTWLPRVEERLWVLKARYGPWQKPIILLLEIPKS